MECSACGTVAKKAGQKFCTACGTKLGGDGGSIAAPAQIQSPVVSSPPASPKTTTTFSVPKTTSTSSSPADSPTQEPGVIGKSPLRPSASL